MIIRLFSPKLGKISYRAWVSEGLGSKSTESAILGGRRVSLLGEKVL